MMRNYNPLVPGTSQSATPMTMSNPSQGSSMGSHPMTLYPPQEPPVNLASKVAEVFLTAGHAFQKLGDLTLQLHTNVEPEECKWSEKEVDQLRDSLTRFAHELDMISQSVQGRTTKHIKTDIKRRHLIPDDARRPISPGMKRQVAMPGGMPTKRMNIVPSSSIKTVPVARTVVPVSAHAQRIPINAHQTQLASAPLLNDGTHYINSGQYPS